MTRIVQGALGPMELERVQSGSDTGLNSLQRWKDMVPTAMSRALRSGKRTAGDLGISEQQFSSQLAYDGQDRRDHLSFWRMRNLPPEFWRELIVLIADFHNITIGGTQQDIEDAAIGRCVREAVKRCR